MCCSSVYDVTLIVVRYFFYHFFYLRTSLKDSLVSFLTTVEE